MWRKQLVASLLLIAVCWPSESEMAKPVTISQPQQQHQLLLGSSGSDMDSVHLADSAYDYDYMLEARGRGGYKRRRLLPQSQAKVKAAATSTERPLIRVWNTFVRSVTPTFGFGNLTNPLANFFNDGTANFIETSPVLDYQEVPLDGEQLEQPVSTTSKRKRKQKRKQQKRRRPIYDEPEDEQIDDYDYYRHRPMSLRQQSPPMYYYDANSNSYYGVQRFSAPDYHHDYNQALYYGQDGIEEAQQSEPAAASSEEQEYRPSLGKLNAKKLTLVRPLANSKPMKLIQQLVTERPAAFVDAATDTSNDAGRIQTDIDESNDSNAAAENEDDGAAMPATQLSESIRNTIGTYMRDDRENRKRQRATAARPASRVQSKNSPRLEERYYWLRAW